MVDLNALNEAVDALIAEENSVKAALDDLAAKVAAGAGVTQADIDAIKDKLVATTDDMKAAVDRDDPATPAPVGTADNAGGVVTPGVPTVGDMGDGSSV